MSKNATILIRYGVIVLLAVFVIGAGYLLSYHKPVKDTPPVASPASGKAKKPQSSVHEVPPPPIPRSDFQYAYNLMNRAVTGKTDVMFQGPETSDPKLAIKTDPTVKEHIDKLRLDISKILDDWRNMLKTLPPNVTDPIITERARQDADTVKQYVDELQKIVDDLTPDNSGLTQDEIDADRAAVEEAIIDAENAVDSLQPTTTPDPTTSPDASPSQPDEPSNPSGTVPDNTPASPTPPPSSDGSTDPSTSDTQAGDNGGDTPPPPPVYEPDHTGSPRLIEGANPIM